MQNSKFLPAQAGKIQFKIRDTKFKIQSMSYRKKHIKGKIHKIKPKKSIFKMLWFWVVILFLVVILSSAYLLLFYSGVQIKNITISGNQKVATQDIKNLISDNINIKILDLGILKINSKSIFLVNSDKLSKELLNKFSTIENVKTDRKFMQTLDLKINERVPTDAFCPSLDKIIETQPGMCYLMDNNGIIFEPLDAIPQNMTILLQSTDNNQVIVGNKIVSQNIIDLLSRVKKNLNDNFQINVKEAIVASNLRLNVNTSENWQIYFDLSSDSDINSQITKLNLLLNGHISPDQRKKLRYIDLRPKDRAIVCDNKVCGG